MVLPHSHQMGDTVVGIIQGRTIAMYFTGIIKISGIHQITVEAERDEAVLDLLPLVAVVAGVGAVVVIGIVDHREGKGRRAFDDIDDLGHGVVVVVEEEEETVDDRSMQRQA